MRSLAHQSLSHCVSPTLSAKNVCKSMYFESFYPYFTNCIADLPFDGLSTAFRASKVSKATFTLQGLMLNSDFLKKIDFFARPFTFPIKCDLL